MVGPPTGPMLADPEVEQPVLGVLEPIEGSGPVGHDGRRRGHVGGVERHCNDGSAAFVEWLLYLRDRSSANRRWRILLFPTLAHDQVRDLSQHGRVLNGRGESLCGP